MNAPIDFTAEERKILLALHRGAYLTEIRENNRTTRFRLRDDCCTVTVDPRTVTGMIVAGYLRDAQRSLSGSAVYYRLALTTEGATAADRLSRAIGA